MAARGQDPPGPLRQDGPAIIAERVRLRTGETHSAERSIPVGASPDTRANHHGLVRARFLAAGRPEETADIAADLPTASAVHVRHAVACLALTTERFESSLS